MKRDHAADAVHDLLEARPTKLFLAVLIVLSVLPYPEIERAGRATFLWVFGLELLVRLWLIYKRRIRRSASEALFVVFDVLAWVSFLPLAGVLGTAGSQALRVLRLTRLLMLLRFGRHLVRDVYSVLTRREQLQQFSLVTMAVVSLSFVSAVLLSQLAIPHDYDSIPGRGEGFWDRMWWAFRQVESPDNLVGNLSVHPLLAVVSLGLTVLGIFVISYLIGVGSNVVDQVVRAERRRGVDYRGHTLVLGPIHENGPLVREFVGIYDKNRALRRLRPREVFRFLFRGGPRPRRHALPRMALLGIREDPPAYLYDEGMRWVVYRQGDPASAEGLARVSAAGAKRVVILAERHADADAISASRLMALRAQNERAHVFVEMRDSQNRRLLEHVGGPGTFILDGSRYVGLFLCHQLFVPGIDRLFRELLSPEGSEFYTHIYVHPTGHEEGMLDFDAMRRTAYERDGVVLTGVLLGDDKFGLHADLVQVDSVTPWVNPFVSRADAAGGTSTEAAIACDTPGQIPARRLRGVFGVAETYLPMRSCGRRVVGIEVGEVPAAKEDPTARAWRDAIRVDPKPLRRVVIVGHGRGLPALLESLAEFVPELEVYVVLTRDLTEAEALRLGVPQDVEPGTEHELPRRGRLVLYPSVPKHALSDRLAALAGADLDAIAFAGDSRPQVESELMAIDAGASMRALEFARRVADAPRTRPLHVLVELGSLDRGAILQKQLERTLSDGSNTARVTVVSTERIQQYFMVHSAFVPGVMKIYNRLLGARGQEIVRVAVPEAALAELRGRTDFAGISNALAACKAIPLALELRSGELLTAPPPGTTVDVQELQAVYVVADSDALVESFSSPA